MIGFTPFPEIETKNLMLRRLNYDDIDDLFKMRSDPRMNEYTDTRLEENTDETRAYIDRMNKGVDENKWVIWAIKHKQLNKVIGSISIWNINIEQMSGELGYGIIPNYQRQGLMKEALLNVIKYGFKIINLKVLDAYTEENNMRSINLLKRCNFIEVNRVDDKGYFKNRVYHMLVYRLESNNFLK